MLLSKTLRSSTFRLAILYVCLFGGSVAGLFGYVYWSTTKYVKQRYDTMMNQLRGLAAGLLFDLVSPMLRSLRFGPDQGGAAIAGTPTGLVSALRKIEAASRAVPLDANPATAHLSIIKPFSAPGARNQAPDDTFPKHGALPSPRTRQLVEALS